MKTFYTRLVSLLFLTMFLSFYSYAQYCTPAVSNTGIYILQINFGPPGTVVGGIQYLTGSDGYTQTVGVTSGTVPRYFGSGFYYSISNPTGGTLPYDFRGFGDWNNDGDFDDVGEVIFNVSGTVVPASSTTTGNTIFPPLSLPPGDYRIRFTLSQDGVATTCGTYTGEVEDYILTVPLNIAPIINTGVVTFPNTALSSATNSNGISVAELINSSRPTDATISDADDMNATWYGLVPSGIAIYNQTATNGTWQYKVGAGAWTAFGSVSINNALLLMADAAYTNYQPGTRIRFVPTGVGAPAFTYKAYDGTAFANGGYADIVAAGVGGSTPFSIADLTAVVPVVASTGFSNGIFIGTLNNNIYKAPLNKIANMVANPEPLLVNSPDYAAADLTLDLVSNKLFWIAGQNADKIGTSDANGGNINTSLITGITYLSGLAVGDGKLYYWNWAPDYSSANLYQANVDGTGIVQISGGAGQFDGTGAGDTRDVEYYNNKIYFQYNSGGRNWIASANADGSGFVTLYDTGNNFGGLTVGSDNTLYWTESDGSVNSMSISGGAVTNIAAEGPSQLGDIEVNVDAGVAYYVYNDGVNPNYSLIRTVPTTGGAVSTALTVSGTATSIGISGTLAVVLALPNTTFSGRYMAQQHASLLQWQTTSEADLSHFVLQRSTDGIHFTDITTMQSTGSVSQGRIYQYTDDVNNVTVDKLYYRLKQVSVNGRFDYSQIVLLKIKAGMIGKVSPNPGNGRYAIQLNGMPKGVVNVRLYNNTGGLIKTDRFNATNYKLDVSSSPSGIYYLQFNYSDGTKEMITLIKQ